MRVLAQCGWNGVINRVQRVPIPRLWGRAHNLCGFRQYGAMVGGTGFEPVTPAV